MEPSGQLRARLGFDLADLEENRMGQLSVAQRRYHRRSAVRALILLPSFMAGIGLFSVTFTLRWLLTVGTLAAIGGAFGLWIYVRTQRALRDGVVECIEGPCASVFEENTFFLDVGGRRLLAQVQGLIVDGEVYRVYFTPRDGAVVSMEPVSVQS